MRDAYAREERRQEEYVVERDISVVPNRSMAMPWTKEAESERRYRRALLFAMLFYIVFGSVILLWKLPPPVRPVVAVVPERLVSMVRKEPPKPEPERRKEENKAEKDQEKAPEKPKEENLSRPPQKHRLRARKRRARVSWPSKRASRT